ncbi:MAG: type II toxin-antitoxin system HicB family antitoxin [Anaerolineae bacterium]|jgi:predicted RNase H-like HicB family nuclease|nr:type II toxin-antitoxin system HicB family antitoxin [Anaerolineae bacterium]
MDKGGWVLKVMGREVWIEVEPETDLLVVSCPDLPGCVTRAESLEEAVLRMEEMIEARSEKPAGLQG